MAAITGLGTTYNMPNYTGLLYGLTPQDTPFFSAIGGLTGGRQSTTTEFEWQTYDLRNPSQRVRLEGQDAPTPEERVRATAYNTTQIHQETVGVSYTKLAAIGNLAGLNTAGRTNPITNELDWQVRTMLVQMVMDIEFSFLQGTYQRPADNLTERKTRGLLEAIVTNTAAAAGDPVDKDMINALLQEVYSNGGIMETGTATLLVPPAQKTRLTNAYITNVAYAETSRTVGGVAVNTLITDFGTLNVMMDRHMPDDTIAVVSLEQCAPVYLEVPGKGHFFAEPLAKTGAYEKVQLYGEVGLAIGNERQHGKITGLAV